MAALSPHATFMDSVWLAQNGGVHPGNALEYFSRSPFYEHHQRADLGESGEELQTFFELVSVNDGQGARAATGFGATAGRNRPPRPRRLRHQVQSAVRPFFPLSLVLRLPGL